MVDVRPLLFINALAIMLLVTAGFASIRDTQGLPAISEQAEHQAPPAEAAGPLSIPRNSSVFVAETAPTEPPAGSAPSVDSEPAAHSNPSASADSARPADSLTPIGALPVENVAVAEAPRILDSEIDAQADTPDTMAGQTATVMTPAPVAAVAGAPGTEPAGRRPTPQAIPIATTRRPSRGHLTLRSNVHDDQVTINGKPYGATRLDVTLEPGRYDIEIRKDGYSPWTQTVALDAGEELTLVGQLDRYTRVDYRGGTWIGGVKTGDGSYNEADGLRYEGHFINGRFHGKGSAWYADGSRYEGDWVEGRREGEGSYTDADNTRYTGQFINDQFNGQGTLSRPNGDILTGQWLNGNLNGHGSLTTGSGMLYVGEFRNGEFHGAGTLTYPDGRSYDGTFSNGKFHGRGSEVFASGKKYEGEYVDGRFHGKGLLLNPNGSSIEATFRHGDPYGQVRLTTAAGEIFTARTSEPGVCYRENSYRATQCPQLEGW
ncbi:PEGA domain-containing protein [Marinobacter mobilis]|uniref:Uncharacterized conserved protein n=1 Tax=Marinobacter mobilis TaxID=488533 RepID=A0A1H2Z1G1_9GAMM|nr:PEGA domain-containing protein [Marinobacter mobilis]SDX11260.1 Uncharacterized conserved protein [Marinobacter mobilis]